GMLGIAFYGGREGQCHVRVFALRGNDFDNPMSPKRQGSGLVEYDGVEISRLFEAAPVAYEQTVSGTKGRRNRRYQWYRQPEGVGTGNHQNRDHPGHCKVDLGSEQ